MAGLFGSLGSWLAYGSTPDPRGDSRCWSLRGVTVDDAHDELPCMTRHDVERVLVDAVDRWGYDRVVDRHGWLTGFGRDVLAGMARDWHSGRYCVGCGS